MSGIIKLSVGLTTQMELEFADSAGSITKQIGWFGGRRPISFTLERLQRLLDLSSNCPPSSQLKRGSIESARRRAEAAAAAAV